MKRPNESHKQLNYFDLKFNLCLFRLNQTKKKRGPQLTGQLAAQLCLHDTAAARGVTMTRSQPSETKQIFRYSRTRFVAPIFNMLQIKQSQNGNQDVSTTLLPLTDFFSALETQIRNCC